MSDIRFQAAQEVIELGKYDAAATILKTMSHVSKASELLVKLQSLMVVDQWEYCEAYWFLAEATQAVISKPAQSEENDDLESLANLITHTFVMKKRCYLNQADFEPGDDIEELASLRDFSDSKDADLIELLQRDEAEFRSEQRRKLMAFSFQLDEATRDAIRDLGLRGWELVTIYHRDLPRWSDLHENVRECLPQLRQAYYFKKRM